jgi:hypothetical protein
MATFDDATLDASIGFDWGTMDANAMLTWYDPATSAWSIKMRYYTAITQANPTTKGVLEDEFFVTITKKAYDPCNDGTISDPTSTSNVNYAWTEGMSLSDSVVDITPSTYTNPTDTCDIKTVFQV